MSDGTQVEDDLHAFLSVTRLPYDPLTKRFLGACRSRTLRVDGRFYKYHQAGSGPTVLLVHGIHSNLGSMVPLAQELLQAGYQVLLFDAPAHGEALGDSTDPFEVRALLRALYDRLGADLHAVVAHSLGGLWALSALTPGVCPGALVLISCPADQQFVLEKFGALHGMGEGRFAAFVTALEQRFGRALWDEFSPERIVDELATPGLLLHGAADDYVPPAHAERLHARWPASTLEVADGVGHFEAAGSPPVITAVATFLTSAEAATTAVE